MTESPPKQLATLKCWVKRHVRLACALGVALGLLNLILVPWLGVPEPGEASAPAWRVQLVGVGVTLGLFISVALLSALLGAGLLRFRYGRPLAVAFSSLVVTTFVSAHLLALAVRLMSGSFVTLGGLEFVLGSLSHFADAALVGYARYTYPLGLTALGLGVGLALYLRRPVPHGNETGLRGALPEGMVICAVAGLALFVGLQHGAGGLHRTTPETAFLGSLGGQLAWFDSADDATGVQVEPGLLQARGVIWEELAASAKRRQVDPPNVLLVMLESVGTGHLGYNGYPRATTPNLDRIAQRSARFRRVWATATHSNYAQMALLSSLFPRRSAGLDMYDEIKYPRVLLHDALHRLNYRAATISSQDETWQGMLKFQQTGTPVEYWHSKDYQGEHVYTGSEHVVPDHITAERAADFISRSAHGPRWGLYVNLQMTHFPYALPPGEVGPFQPSDPLGSFTYLYYAKSDVERVVNRYDNALRYVDAQLGALERALEQSGQLDNTLWVITSDHGEAFYHHGGVTHGKTLYEEEARVPLLMHWPKAIAPRDLDVPASHLDVLPTVLELVGVPAHPSHQGQSLASLVRGEAVRVDRAPEGLPAQAVFMNIQGIRNADAVVCWPWKLILERSSQQVMLFNLELDPQETSNWVTKQTAIATSLGRLLERQMSAQTRYHAEAYDTHFQPRLLSCPELPGAMQAAR